MLSVRHMAVAAALSATVAANCASCHGFPEPRQAGRFTFYNMLTPAAGPCDLAEGPDGALWGEDILVNKIFRVDPTTSSVQEFAIPFTSGPSNITIPGISQIVQDRTALSCAIRNGEDGNLYASNGLRNQLVRINPFTKAITVINPTPPDPAGNLFPFNDITPAPGGLYITQTTGNIFQFYNFTDESFTTYEVPTKVALPLGLILGSNGLLYIAELNANQILEFNPKTKAVKEYALPQLEQGPAVVRAEYKGYVYFSLFEGNGIGRINMMTHAIDLYHTSQLGGLGSVTTQDKNGGVWLSFFTANVMARLDTGSLTYNYVAFPDTFAQGGLPGILGDLPPYADISVNYGPGDAIWFGSVTKNQVARYSLA
jgi:streptogramin lyase